MFLTFGPFKTSIYSEKEKKKVMVEMSAREVFFEFSSQIEKEHGI
jgi:hypothetical protein